MYNIDGILSQESLLEGKRPNDIRFQSVVHLSQNQEPGGGGCQLEVPKGRFFGFKICGAGKSTTQKILIRLLQGYHGDIRADGQATGAMG